MSRLNIASNPPTRRIGETVHSFATARRFLNGKDQRKLANNTTVIRLSDDAIGVKLHSTIIVEYYDDGRVILRSGGHHTRTTAQRINQLLPPGASVFQKAYTWYVSIRGETREFHEGITLMDDFHAPVSYPEPFPILVGDEAKAYQPTAVSRLLRQHKGHGTNPNPEYGVFKWSIHNRYRISDAVKLYASKAAAEKYANKLNDEDGEHGSGGYVVRTLRYLPNPSAHGNDVTGYLASKAFGEILRGFDGAPIPVGRKKDSHWTINRVIAEYRDRHGLRSVAVILRGVQHGNFIDAYAGGALLLDGGSLFRGERLDPDESPQEKQTSAKNVAEYWLSLDAEQVDDEYDDHVDAGELDAERRLGGGDEGYDYDEEG